LTTPTSFPAWLSRAGQPDALIFDATGYNTATAQGYIYPVAAVATATAAAGQPVTPQLVVSPTLTIRPTSLNNEQDDGRPKSARR
jgi:hypothetical protein